MLRISPSTRRSRYSHGFGTLISTSTPMKGYFVHSCHSFVLRQTIVPSRRHALVVRLEDEEYIVRKGMNRHIETSPAYVRCCRENLSTSHKSRRWMCSIVGSTIRKKTGSTVRQAVAEQQTLVKKASDASPHKPSLWSLDSIIHGTVIREICCAMKSSTWLTAEVSSSALLLKKCSTLVALADVVHLHERKPKQAQADECYEQVDAWT